MKFTDDEKAIIGYILEVDKSSAPNCLSNIWEKILPGIRINFYEKGGFGERGRIFADQTSVNNLGADILDKHLTSTILLLLDLFERLEEEKLIRPFIPNQKLWFLGDDLLESEGIEIHQSVGLRQKLAKLTRKQFGVSEKLKALLEQTPTKQRIDWIWIGMAIVKTIFFIGAIVGLLVGIIQLLRWLL